MKLTIHPTVTEDRVLEACERRELTLDNPGICVLCGADHDSCEPDARRYGCESCGERGVYGAEELLMRGAYHRPKKEEAKS
jgi:hypothetical protein